MIGGFCMDLNYNLALAQEQRLVMTQEMQLSVKLLQMSAYELQEYVDKELQENPVLDEEINIDSSVKKEEIDFKSLAKSLKSDNYSTQTYQKDEEEVSLFNFISEKKSLKQYLIEQIMDLNENDYIKKICCYIIENINDRGYLSMNIGDIVDELNISLEIANYSLNVVQSLEPDGIGARDLKECLKIQVRKKGIENDCIYKIIDNYLEYLADNKYAVIAKALGVDVKQAQKYGDVIKNLQPKPSRGFFTGEEVRYITPDAYIKKIDNEYLIFMNDELIPRLKVNNIYKEILMKDCDTEACEYVKDKINSALFLIRSIEQRRSTIYRVVDKLLQIQKDYFEKGESYLKPMTLKEIADELSMHESTISRAIRDKYIHTNRGTIKIKSLFSSKISSNCSGEDISSHNIKQKIKDLIDREDMNAPLSDQTIDDILRKQGMSISRRTVAKYREELGIKSSKGRKRF